MKSKWLKLAAIPALFAILGVLALGTVAWAQGPTPTNPNPAPNGNTTPGWGPGWHMWGNNNSPMMGRGFGMMGGMGMMHGSFGMMGGRSSMMGGSFGMMGSQSSILNVSAQVLGISETDLLAELQGGKTVDEIAQSKNISTDKIVEQFVQARAAWLKSAVDARQMTQAQADAKVAMMKAHLESWLTTKYDPQGFGPRFGTMGLDADGDGLCDMWESFQQN